MRLVDDWKKCLKWFSVQANMIGVAITSTYAAMYQELKADFPPKYMLLVTAGVFVLGIIGRVVSQTPKAENDPK